MSQPARERPECLVPEPALVTDGEEGVGVVQLEQRERVLHPFVASEPFELRDLDGLCELLGAEVGRSDRADRPGTDQLVERPERLLVRCIGIEVVRHVQRNPLESEPLQARLDLPPDPLT